MLLFVDACAREESRTKELAQYLLDQLHTPYTAIHLYQEEIPTLDENLLQKRTRLCKEKVYSDDLFRYAKQFAEAETIVIAAPYWDLSFPAILKKYIESICVNGITFQYGNDGYPMGLCKAKKLYYVTTAGGYIYNHAFGDGYVTSLAKTMFGIQDVIVYSAEGLDIQENSVSQIMKQCKQKISKEMNN